MKLYIYYHKYGELSSLRAVLPPLGAKHLFIIIFKFSEKAQNRCIGEGILVGKARILTKTPRKVW